MRFQYTLLVFLLCGFASVFATSAEKQAFLLASTVSKNLLPENAMVTRITQDLQAIYTTVPATKELSPLYPWVPGQIIVGFEKGGRQKFMTKALPELTAANETYGPVTIKPFGRLEAATLTFAKPYHPELLAKKYGSLAGAKYAEPNYVVGGGDQVEVSADTEGNLTYLFSKGWGDCPAGCINRHFWKVSVTDGKAILLKEYGTPLP